MKRIKYLILYPMKIKSFKKLKKRIMLTYTNKRIVEVSDWDDLVISTYGKPYNFQQQNGCQERGQVDISIPNTDWDDEFDNDSIPELVNGEEMGVKFEAWLARDPKQGLRGEDGDDEFDIELFWERNFYPSLQTVANDLHKKGLIEAGDYIINIDW